MSKQFGRLYNFEGLDTGIRIEILALSIEKANQKAKEIFNSIENYKIL